MQTPAPKVRTARARHRLNQFSLGPFRKIFSEQFLDLLRQRSRHASINFGFRALAKVQTLH